jgi:hypothetical protein
MSRGIPFRWAFFRVQKMGPIEIRRDHANVIFVGDDATASTLPNVVRIKIEPQMPAFQPKHLKRIGEVIERRPLNRAERRARKQGR